MCGIAGYLSFNTNPVQEPLLKRMTDVIAHRGPDGEGHWTNKSRKIGFGHRRLSIIDLSENGKQPLHYSEGRYTITFNGEIYNYIEIKNELLKKGYKFSSESDTEVLLALYDLKKENCLADLDGMFSFAIWDEKEQTLFCARDRFGEKPFHYYADGEKFLFASEIKQFWPAGIIKRLDNDKLYHYATTGVIETKETLTETFYNGIKKLDAAHYLTIDAASNIKIVNYWKIDREAPAFKGSIEQAAEKFLHLFTEAIRLRLRSDVPVGSSLSGGLDSSSIVMLIDALKGEQLNQNTFSARFKNFAKDEGKYVEEVVKKCKNVTVHYTWPDADYFEKVLEKVVDAQDEPFGSASIVAQYAVMEIAKQNNVTVLLDGQGADEELAGYLPYYSIYLDKLFYTNHNLFKKERESFNKFHGAVTNYKEPIHAETFRMKLGRYRRMITGQHSYFDKILNDRLINDTSVNGLKELLRYADRNSMAHSREVRLPFLSHKLVEFIFSLPDEYKLNNGWTKFVLRKAMNNILPNDICWRVDKIGYEPPQKEWLKNGKYHARVVKAAKELTIPLEANINPANMFTQEWRLLMASYYL
ncbi:MAG: asparagine synthase (glutamine-hydrolyzing) [Bacteroidetes bacterium]|nr:asparagine synthase (glutamine-hydrolyzing) [Bacteroidota bacterium]